MKMLNQVGQALSHKSHPGILPGDIICPSSWLPQSQIQTFVTTLVIQDYNSLHVSLLSHTTDGRDTAVAIFVAHHMAGPPV